MSNILQYFGYGLPQIAQQAQRQSPLTVSSGFPPTLRQMKQILLARFAPMGMTKERLDAMPLEQIENMYATSTHYDEYGQSIPEHPPYYSPNAPYATRKIAKTPTNENDPKGVPSSAVPPYLTQQFGPSPPPMSDEEETRWHGVEAVKAALQPGPDWATALRDAIVRNMTPGQLPPPTNDVPLGPYSSIDMPPSRLPGVTHDVIMNPQGYSVPQPMPMTPPQAITRPPSGLQGKEEKSQKEREGDEPQNTE